MCAKKGLPNSEKSLNVPNDESSDVDQANDKNKSDGNDNIFSFLFFFGIGQDLCLAFGVTSHCDIRMLGKAVGY